MIVSVYLRVFVIFVITHWVWLCGLLAGMLVFSWFGKCWCFVVFVCVWW